MGKLNIPPYLEPGDAIGIVAPARRVLPEEVDPFKKLIEARGYLCLEAGNLYGSLGQFSGTPEQRLADIQQMLMNPEVKAIFAARGGYGAAQLLQGMDWELVRENPKWMIGFSDVTALHAAFGRFTETIHGPMPYSLVMDPPQDKQSFDYLFQLLQGEKVRYKLPADKFNIPGKVRAPLTGGNLSVLYSLAGSRFEPDYEGSILFLEDLDEYLYHIHRMILNLELRDVFKKVAGLLVGSFSDLNDNEQPFGSTAYEMIAEKAEKYNIPALFGFPAGHEKINYPLIFGRVSTLTIEKGGCSLEMF